MSAFPAVDATKQDAITDEQAEFFRDNGLLVIRNVVRGEELARLQAETQVLIDQAAAGVDHPDFMYSNHEITGERTPKRIEYVIERSAACKALLGHPFILRSVEKLQGANLIPTWDSVVFKFPGKGAGVPWHRDSGNGCGADSQRPIFNVDFYLDVADLSNCVWGILGSNQWPQQRANETIARLNAGGFQTGEGAQPIEMRPGDVLLHNILALHGSRPSQSHLRRVIYYEFRPGEIEWEHGPHNHEYLPLKQQVLEACLRHRARAPYTRGEKPFVYRPTGRFALPAIAAEPATYRYPHGEFRRAVAAAR